MHYEFYHSRLLSDEGESAALAGGVLRLLRQLKRDPNFVPPEGSSLETVSRHGHVVLAWEMDAVKSGRRQRLVGMATLIPILTLSGSEGRVESVIVDEEYRGRGIGRGLMRHLIEEAKRQGLDHLELTSQPFREAAHAMYHSLGFERRETNVYRLML